MDNVVKKAAFEVREQLLKTEHASNIAVEQTAYLLGILAGKRSSLECPISLANEEIDRLYQALGRSIGSLRCLAITHKGLHVIADEGDGGSNYGTTRTVGLDGVERERHLKVA